MKSGRKIVRVAVLAFSLSGPTTLLAQELGGPPKPAAREYLPLADLSNDESQANSQLVTPDTRPLTGAQTPTLGSPEIRHSYWVPGFQYENFILSSSLRNPAVSYWNSTSYVGGTFNLLESGRHSQFNVNYAGGAFSSTGNAVGNGYYHQLGIVQQFDWRRWQLAFINQFAYLPQTQFGFGAGTNLSLPGIAGTLGTQLPGLQGTYLPSQSIYSALGPRYSNAFVTQIGYRISPRSSLILAGSYGVLHFTDPGNIDTNDAIFSVGYEYEVSRNSTLGVLYRFSGYHFAGDPQAIGDHAIQLAYGRKITGRIALQLFGGPEITQLRVPIGASDQHISGAGAANLTFAFTDRTNLSGGYTHGVSGGSGVFTGATSDQVQGSLGHQLSRQWRGGIHFGYSRNGPVLQSGSQSAPHFNTWYAGTNLERPLGPRAHFNLAYTVYSESPDQGIPSISAPLTGYAQHQITVEFGWHTRPVVIR
jgi:hypothetical protein